MATLVGKTLKNRYRVDEFLGRGGMAEVYRVYDLQRGVPLAMKLLREDLAEDRVFMRRFAREAQNLTRLQHPNIVRCYGLEQEGRTAYMLMDFIEGGTLRAVLSDYGRPLSNKHILEILRPVCSALDYAHQMGVVHCDVKSANIMINSSGAVFLTDFGVARSLDAATSTMVGVGTPAYMAPEVIMGQDPTAETDIYALGILLYEMLTGGERPFTGDRAAVTGTTAEKVRWEHLKLDPLPVSTYNPDVGEALEAVIIKALNKKAAKRYHSAQDLLTAAAQAMDIDMQTIREHTSFTPPPEVIPEPQPLSRPYTPPSYQKPEESKSPMLGIGIGVAVVILIIWIISASGRGDSSSSSSLRSSSSSSSSSSSHTSAPTYSFSAADTSIRAGDCTQLYWSVDGAQDVYFEGNWVEADSSAQICPDSTTTYQLTIEGEDGEVYIRSLTVDVEQSSAQSSSSGGSKSGSNSTCEGTANDSNVNIRSGPNGDIIGCCLGAGDEVTIYEVNSSGKWGRIVSERGHKGWVSMQFIDVDRSCDIDDLK